MCTPYMLAILREEYEIADLLLQNNRSDKYFKNSRGQQVYDIATKYKLKSV